MKNNKLNILNNKKENLNSFIYNEEDNILINII